eukprot:jgi/Bigna1/41121/e_gw1.49.108.1
MASTKKGESNENDNAEETTIAASTTSGLSINRIKNIRRVFIEVAKDDSELLRVESLPEALESLGMNDTKNEILNEVKLNMQGLFEYLENVCFIRYNFYKEASNEKIKKKFDEIDTSSSGTISLKEFKVAMSFLEEEFNEDEIKKMFDEMDINGDGKIDYSEFLLSAGRI